MAIEIHVLATVKAPVMSPEFGALWKVKAPGYIRVKPRYFPVGWGALIYIDWCIMQSKLTRLQVVLACQCRINSICRHHLKRRPLWCLRRQISLIKWDMKTVYCSFRQTRLWPNMETVETIWCSYRNTQHNTVVDSYIVDGHYCNY